MDGVFLCYRRGDAGDAVGRIRDRLEYRYGPDFIFRDVDDIPLGADFRAEIAEALENVKFVLVAIGPTWLTAMSASGQRRLEQPRDAVRIEIESALGSGKTVIPLLIRGAQMPDAEDLPESISGLADINGLAIRQDPDFDIDIERLLKRIGAPDGPAHSSPAATQPPAGIPATAPLAPPPRTEPPATPQATGIRGLSTGAIAGIAAAAVVIIVAIAVLALGGGNEAADDVAVLAEEITTSVTSGEPATAEPTVATTATEAISDPGPSTSASTAGDGVVDLADADAGANGSVALADLIPGDCFDDPPLEADRVDLISCDLPHDNEAYFDFLLPEGPYPALEDVEFLAIDQCLAAFESYTGSVYETSILDFDFYYPPPEGWAVGDRIVTCFLYHVDLLPLTGTAAGSGV